MPHQWGMGLGKCHEWLPVQDQAIGRLRGLGVGGSGGLLVKQRQLPERVAGREQRKHDLLTLTAEVGDLHLAVGDHVEGVSRITLAKDVGAPGKAARLQPGAERLELRFGKATEQRRAGKQSDAVGHWVFPARRAGWRSRGAAAPWPAL